MPWLGWFDLADQVDFFIILDDVAFSKQSWQQRNRIRVREGLAFLSVPVKTAGRLGQPIYEAEITDVKFADKILRTISSNYAKAPYFNEFFPEFKEVFLTHASTQNLSILNRGLIEWFMKGLGINTPSICSSKLPVTGRRGEYVAKLCEHFEAHRYISPAGAQEYLLEDATEFYSRSIDVDLQSYEHPVYQQCFMPFEPYASILDLILNEGGNAGGVLRSGRRPPDRLLSCAATGGSGTRVPSPHDSGL